MKNASLLLLCTLIGGCATQAPESAPRSQALIDIEGYAVASCLTLQADPYLRDQGDGWAAVIVQRAQGDLDGLATIAEAVRHASSENPMAIIRAEGDAGKDKSLPILYCNELIDTPTVRQAIRQTVTAFSPLYQP